MKHKTFIKWIASVFVLLVLCMSAFLLSITASESTDDLNITYGNLDFNNEIHLMYAIRSSSPDVVLLIWDQARAEFTYGTQKETVLPNTEQMTIGGSPYTVFEYTGLAAKNMTDVVYARAYNTKTDKYGNMNKFSILQYAYIMLGKTGTASSNTAYKDMLSQMLEYGATAQAYFKHRPTRLANAEWVEIKTKNGRLSDGFTSGLYLPGDQIVLNAPETSASGTAFLYWQDSAQKVISNSPSFTLTVGASNETYTAVYESCRHVAVVDKAVAPTCTGTGLTVGSHCSLCGKILEAQETVPATGHKEVTVPKKDATCTEDGATDGKQCSVCHVVTVEPEVIPAAHTPKVTSEALEATCTTDGLTEAIVCTTCKEVLQTQELIPATGHSYGDNGYCSACGIPKSGTEGLTYESVDDGYVVTGIKNEYTKEIVIPEFYEDRPVVGIMDGAFAGNSTITKVYIPHSVIDIGEGAFMECTSLTSVTILNSETVIGKQAFTFCAALTTLSTPNGLSVIGESAFEFCDLLTTVTIPAYLTRVETTAFARCGELTEITLPRSLTFLAPYAFSGSTALTTVRYSGTTAEWLALCEQSGWESHVWSYTVVCSNGSLTEYP